MVFVLANTFISIDALAHGNFKAPVGENTP